MLKRIVSGSLIALGLLLLTPTPHADARGWWSSRQGRSHHRHHRHSWWRSYRTTSPQSAPELDPSGAGSALVLLLGGVAYIASRRREEDAA